MMPTNFDEWKNCIEVKCKIPLTKDFAASRLQIYTDHSKQETQKFIELYGTAHLNNIITWYNKI